MIEDKMQSYFLFSTFIVTMTLVVLIFLPYLTIIALSGVLAVVFHPLYKKVLSYTKNRRSIASSITTLIVIALFVVPLFWFGMNVLGESVSLYNQLISEDTRIISTFRHWESSIAQQYPEINLDFDNYLLQGLNWIVQNLGGIFAGIAQTLFRIILGVIAFYYFVKDGEEFVKLLLRFSPLSNNQSMTVVTNLNKSINSVISGSLIISITQGILTALGMMIFGVPKPSLLGMLAAIISVIPNLGTGLITLPVAIILLANGHILKGIGMGLWGALAVGLVDNILGPKIVSRSVKIHPFLILISVLGGLQFFGPSGFILGPLSLSLLFALTEIYVKSVKTNSH